MLLKRRHRNFKYLNQCSIIYIIYTGSIDDIRSKAAKIFGKEISIVQWFTSQNPFSARVKPRERASRR